MIVRSELLDQRRAQPFVKLAPLDAGTLEVVDGAMVTITAGAVQVTAPVAVDAALQPGTVVIPLDVHPAFNALAESEGALAQVSKAEMEPA
jgi:anaerobic selenocysteine-containing dehydrogenase